MTRSSFLFTHTTRTDLTVDCGAIDVFFKQSEYRQQAKKGQDFIITEPYLIKILQQKLNDYSDYHPVIITGRNQDASCGEGLKTQKAFMDLWEQLCNHHIQRGDRLIAFGGGAVGDITGFLASIIHRGVELVMMPTTLLAMVDSAFGGKTGINSAIGKNTIGTFYPAHQIICDPYILASLSQHDFKSGLGEVIKYVFLIQDTEKRKNVHELLLGFSKKIKKMPLSLPFSLSGIFSEDLSGSLSGKKSSCKQQDYDDMKKIISTCLQVKYQYVQGDLYDRENQRAALNIGHNIAHAVEYLGLNQLNQSRQANQNNQLDQRAQSLQSPQLQPQNNNHFSHGFCVVYGLLVEFLFLKAWAEKDQAGVEKERTSPRQVMLDKLQHLLDAMGMFHDLPLLNDQQVKQVIDHLCYDKKNTKTSMRFVDIMIQNQDQSQDKGKDVWMMNMVDIPYPQSLSKDDYIYEYLHDAFDRAHAIIRQYSEKT
jgi:3-dehydroquinate synthetase